MRFIRLIAVTVGLAGLFALTNAAEPSREDFEKLHEELVSVREPWQELPWELSLVQACRRAARENKPVYMLCRSGHPLGCV